MSAADKAPLEAAINDLKTVMAGDSISDIEAKTTALQMALVNFNQKQAPAAAAASEQAQATGDDVVDADFEEVDDQDKRRHG